MSELEELLTSAMDALVKQGEPAASFIPANQLAPMQAPPPVPGGAPGGAPGGMDPAMAAMGGMDPAMAGMDPAAMGMDPMAGMDPAAMGMDPMAGMAPPPTEAGGGGGAPLSPELQAMVDAVVSAIGGGKGKGSGKPKRNADDMLWKIFVLLKGIYQQANLTIPPEILDDPSDSAGGDKGSEGAEKSGAALVEPPTYDTEAALASHGVTNLEETLASMYEDPSLQGAATDGLLDWLQQD